MASVNMDKKLIAKLKAEARKNAKKLNRIEQDKKYLDKAERFQREIS